MYAFWWNRCALPSRRQLLAAAQIAAVLLAFLPLPVSTVPSNTAKDRSVPFPCQDRPCGCRSAEQCRKKCCCFTGQQKLAWAKQNGIDPSHVVTIQSGDQQPKSTKKQCCSTQGNSVCTKSASQLSRARPVQKSRQRFVIGISALDCQGSTTMLLGQAVFVVPVPCPVTESFQAVIDRLSPEETPFCQLFGEPPVPPPRLFSIA